MAPHQLPAWCAHIHTSPWAVLVQYSYCHMDFSSIIWSKKLFNSSFAPDLTALGKHVLSIFSMEKPNSKKVPDYRTTVLQMEQTLTAQDAFCFCVNFTTIQWIYLKHSGTVFILNLFLPKTFLFCWFLSHIKVEKELTWFIWFIFWHIRKTFLYPLSSHVYLLRRTRTLLQKYGILRNVQCISWIAFHLLSTHTLELNPPKSVRGEFQQVNISLV